MYLPKGTRLNFFMMFCVFILCTGQYYNVLGAELANIEEMTAEYNGSLAYTTLKKYRNRSKRWVYRARSKRWDYRADGCHCSGYNVECLQDIFCQKKQKSPMWYCQKNCCGFKCVKSE